MDNMWLWPVGVFALIILAALALSMFRRQDPVSRKPENRRVEPKEEFAEDISPLAPKTIPLQREKHHRPNRQEEEELFIPHYYGVDRMVLIAKDPSWLYAYWEVSEHRRHEFIQQYGEEAWHTSQQVLRVYDVTESTESPMLIFHSYRELAVDPFADNWFIEVGQADRCFIVELGRLLADGSYVKLLQSNVATTPRSTLSNKVDAQWMSIDGIYQAIHRDSIGSSEMMMGKVEGGLEPLGFSSPGYKQ